MVKSEISIKPFRMLMMLKNASNEMVCLYADSQHQPRTLLNGAFSTFELKSIRGIRFRRAECTSFGHNGLCKYRKSLFGANYARF